MKNLNKKGFTIVELVIVIAVIGILAGVLIPTFSGVIANANQNAALQAARGFLTNALNMSSTASLPGKGSDNKYQTVFFVDQNDDGIVDYQFMYDGNALEAVNRQANKLGDTWNFNSVLIYSESMLTTYATETTVDATGTTPAHTEYSNFHLEAEKTSGQVEAPNNFTLAVKTANMIYSAINYTDNYKLKTDNSGLIYAGDDAETNHYNKLSIAGGIKFDGKDYEPDYTYTSGDNPSIDKAKSAYTDNADNLKRFYLNSDFNRKVIVFTTFGI